MYRLEFLPAARQDMIDIVQYISRELQNPVAAEKLTVKMMDAADSLLSFPYANQAYAPIRPLIHEYRKLLVENYILFYWVDEPSHLITVARVIYARRDYEKRL